MHKWYTALTFAGLMTLGSGKSAAQTTTPVTTEKKKHSQGHHSADVKKKDFGTTTIAGVKFARITQKGAIIPGMEGAFDVLLAEGTKTPQALQAWIGVASAEGSVKARLERRPMRYYHSHVEVPKDLPAGSQYWLEVEPQQGPSERAAFDFFTETD